MWSLLLLLYTAFTEPLITQGDNRLILISGSHPCEGYIGIYHDGQLGYVGHKTWSDNIEKVVCRTTQCGEPKSSSIKTAPLRDYKVWLNDVNCTGNEDHLWDCKYPGWGISFFSTGTLTKIQCSNEITFSLDGFRCAGAVKYHSSKDGMETDSGYLCDDNLEKSQKDLLCKNLNCGESKEPSQKDWMDWKEFENSKKMKIDCSDITDVTYLWQCASKESKPCQKPASVMCTDFKRLQLQGNTSNVCSGQLEEMKSNEVWSNWSGPVSTSKTGPDVWCQQMHCGTNVNHSTDNGITKLHCSDNVKVVLMSDNQPSKCYGAVNIEVNGSPRPVCATTWTQKEAAVVCKELNCGDVHIQIKKPLRSVEGIMDNVKCSGNEASLWHCNAKHDSSCSSEAYVVCSGSMEVRLADGPGKCAGRVEILYEGRWQQVLEVQKDDNLDAVCRELGCGNERNPTKRTEKFCQGSGDFLSVTCKSTDKNISECTLKTLKMDEGAKAEAKAQGITCEEHKVVILEGGDSCSGRVGIKHGTNTKWLSGSNETWNQQSANTVCQQMHCGNALSFKSESTPDIQKDVWPESYKCSSDKKSLFDCDKNKQPDHGNTSATVKCSGKLEVKLSKSCWGNVSVCVDDKKCGSMCADTWEEKNSEMLCKNLGCGDRVLTRITKPRESKALFTSLHCTDEATNLTQCNFVRNENGISCEQAYVVCSGSVKSEFSDTRDKCYGNVVVHYEDRRLPVCKAALDNKTQNIICGEQNCGQADKEIDYFGPKTVENYHISQITYADKSLTSCDVKSEKDFCELGGLQCSDWRKMALTLGKACSGAVSVHSKEGKISAVSSEGWSATERDRLCQDLQCGKFRSNEMTPLTQSVLWPTSFSCEGVEKKLGNIWDCENQTSSSQGNTTQQQLEIECEGEPNVTFSPTCRGEVKINGIEVCATKWKDKYSHFVCQNMGCGNAVPGSFRGNKSKKGEQYFHVSCEDNHFELGQCKRVKKDCEGTLVSVNCVKQIQFNTSEKCGGRIEVNYRDNWEYVCPLKSFPPELMDSLCVDCDGHNRSIKTPQNKSVVTLETTLNCTSDTKDVKYCVRTQPCIDIPAEIYCNKYVFPTIPKPETIPDRTVEIIVGVGFVLVLVVLIVVFIIICVVRKAKIFSSRKLQRKEVEFESGDYDDVTSKANEMEVLSGGRFPSETEFITENDARSTSSFPYDDIDDMAVAQPLTSKAATAAASGDNDNHEGDLHQSADGVIYEVDDPQENYEDIEAKIIQTEAEVHNSPQTTPESDAAPPPGLEQGDEDYLVPGQDG